MAVHIKSCPSAVPSTCSNLVTLADNLHQNQPLALALETENWFHHNVELHFLVSCTTQLTEFRAPISVTYGLFSKTFISDGDIAIPRVSYVG